MQTIYREGEGFVDVREQMSALALSFPSLREAPVEPWDPHKLEKWSVGPAPGSGAFHAARFVLNVWNDSTEWACGKFEFFEAFRSWDHNHKVAFLAWAGRPWWP
jgi:hypothetical protein